MTYYSFFALVQALATDAQASTTEDPTELELITESCIVQVIPTESGTELGVIVRYQSEADNALFTSPEVLQLQIRLHQGTESAGNWSFALADDLSPIFALKIPAEAVDVARFDELMQEAVDHAELALKLAKCLETPNTDVLIPINHLHLRG
jgi:hypothetical protein